MKEFLIGIGGLVTVTAAIVFRGVALSWIWFWFVVPLGVPVIGIAWAIGLSGLIATITHQDVVTVDRDIGPALALAFLQPAFALLFGLIVHAFM